MFTMASDAGMIERKSQNAAAAAAVVTCTSRARWNTRRATDTSDSCDMCAEVIRS